MIRTNVYKVSQAGIYLKKSKDRFPITNVGNDGEDELQSNAGSSQS